MMETSSHDAMYEIQFDCPPDPRILNPLEERVDIRMQPMLTETIMQTITVNTISFANETKFYEDGNRNHRTETV